MTATTLKERFLWCGQRRTDELILPPDFRKSPADRTCHPKRHRRQHTCAKFDSRRNFTRLILACAWHTARRVDNGPCTLRYHISFSACQCCLSARATACQAGASAMSSVAYAHAKFATYWASTTSQSTDPLHQTPSERVRSPASNTLACCAMKSLHGRNANSSGLASLGYVC